MTFSTANDLQSTVDTEGSFAVQMLRGILSLISTQIFQVDLWKAKRCVHGRQHPGTGERMGSACLGMRWEGIKG